MKTYKQPITEILANLKGKYKHGLVVFGTCHPIFVSTLIKMAQNNTQRVFYNPYDGNKTEDDNLKILDLARMYSKFDFPDNILFEEKFAELIQEYKKAKLN